LKAEELKNLDLKRNLLPKGTIIAWYGQNLIPDGWVICDGNNGTPDLRNKFLRGGTIDQFGETEGKNWIIDGQTDGHKLTIAEIPAHDHNFQGNLDGGAQLHWFGSRPGARDPVPTITPGGGSVEMWKVGGNQPHFHTIQGHDNRPEFMSIVFIMKL
jgi:microcystin-dependent protein